MNPHSLVAKNSLSSCWLSSLSDVKTCCSYSTLSVTDKALLQISINLLHIWKFLRGQRHRVRHRFLNQTSTHYSTMVCGYISTLHNGQQSLSFHSFKWGIFLYLDSLLLVSLWRFYFFFSWTATWIRSTLMASTKFEDKSRIHLQVPLCILASVNLGFGIVYSSEPVGTYLGSDSFIGSPSSS